MDIQQNKHNQAIRIIAGIKYREHTVPLFKQLEILPIDLLYIQHLIILMYNVYHQRCPTHTSNLVKLNTRNKCKEDKLMTFLFLQQG